MKAQQHPGALLRHSKWDALLISLAFAHGLLLLLAPSLALIAVGLWWNTNTIGHNFIHLPFFRSTRLNQLFAAYLSVVTGVPQRLWRERHLAHHREIKWKLRWSEELAVQSLLVLLTWATIVAAAPKFFVWVYLPGYALGLGLCRVQGHYEHARGTVSHYGRLYNLLFFNDGFHVEHHARPGRHWRGLTADGAGISRGSRWPAVARWLEAKPLHALERIVTRSALLRRFVLGCHERAWRRLELPPLAHVTIVGGGLFPRTALVLRKLLPQTNLTIIDALPQHIESARAWLDGSVHYKTAFYNVEGADDLGGESDLIVFPLSFDGLKKQIYARSPARLVVVHDWIWRPRGETTIVSWLLLKRLNLVRR